jgi:hypothetical protein
MRQTSFAAGELSPLLWGRTDLELWRHGARRLLNFVVNRQGNAVSRSGFRSAWQARAARAVLVPLLHPSGESYVCEFSNLWVRIYDARTLVLAGELATPFQSADLAELQWAQQGNTLVLTHPLRAPQELRVASSITITSLRFGPPGDNPGDAALQACFPSIGGNPPSMPVLVSWQPTSLFVIDAAHPPREWRYKVSTIVQHVLTGQLAETLPRDITHYVNGNIANDTLPPFPGSQIPLPADGQLVLFDDAPIYIEPGLGDSAVSTPVNWVPIENLYYRGRGQLFGLVGRCAPNARFADFGDEPDYATPPLRGDSPFAGENPTACAFFGQRRVFAMPSQRFVASAVDDFSDHDKPILNWSGQPLEATLVHQRRERAVAMAQLEHLFLLTDTAAWCIGRPDVPLDFDTFASAVRVVDDYGALPMQPVTVDGAVLYGVAKGRGVRALQFRDGGGVAGVDVSWVAEHLFRTANARIVSWCYQREPWNAVWAVTDAGKLVTLSRSGNTWAWARHDVGGRVLSVCSVPEADTTAARGDSDLVFALVERTGGTFVEKLTPHTIGELPRYASDPLYSGNPIGSEQTSYPLDGYVVATITKATGTTVTGLGHLEGREVWVSCPGIAPVSLGGVVGGAATTPAGWGPDGAVTFRAAVGAAFVLELETLDVAPATATQKNVVSVAFEVDGAQGLEVGQDFGHLVPWQQRTVQDSYDFPVPATTLVNVTVKGSWQLHGRAALRQSKPLPVTVLGVRRELDVGGR